MADTNNHLIRVVDLKDNRVSTLAIAGLTPPEPPKEAKPSFVLPGAVQETVPLATVRPENGQVRLAVELQLPAGYKINEAAPTAYRVDFPGGEGREAGGRKGDWLRVPEVPVPFSGVGAGGPIVCDKFAKPIRVPKPAANFEIALPVSAETGRDTVRISLNYFYCRSGAEGLCKAGSAVWTVPIELKADAVTTVIPLRHRVR